MDANRRVLIVDDSYFMRKLLRMCLNDSNYNIIGMAMTVDDALFLNNRLKPDIVFLDISILFNDIDKTMHAFLESNIDAKYIICSNMYQSQLTLAAIKTGATDFIAKPFLKDKVISVINKY